MGNCHICHVPCNGMCAECLNHICEDCARYEERPDYAISSWVLVCKYHRPRWLKWIYVYLCHALECDQPILESLHFTLASLFPQHSGAHELYEQIQMITEGQEKEEKEKLKTQAKKEKQRTRETRKRDLSPLRGSDSEEEVYSKDDDEVVHPIRSLYFPADPAQDRHQKIRAVIELRDNQKWLSVDWRPWGGENQPGIVRCTPNTPNEIMIFIYLVTREVVHGLSIGKWRHYDQKRRYKKFKANNAEILKKANEIGVMPKSNYRFLPLGSGVYFDNDYD
jgi:hypothetical protein